MNTNFKKSPIVTIPIPLASGKTGWIAAGPTRELPSSHLLVRCAREIKVSPDSIAFDVGTADFTTFDESVVKLHLPGILEALEDGERLYVGCAGGTGRTGTLLAILVAQHPAFSGQAAIDYIRKVYRPHAIETPEQEEQVRRMAGLNLWPLPTPALNVHSSAMMDRAEPPLAEPKRSFWDRIKSAWY